jgi:hypothetical protein
MDVTDTESRVSPAQIARTFSRIVRTWTGCDWPIQFGKLGLNLNGLTSMQAALMAGATSGEESAEWRRACRWLASVEHDAQKAERFARTAADLAIRGRPDEAMEAMKHACQLEAVYHDQLVWQELRDALAAYQQDPGWSS